MTVLYKLARSLGRKDEQPNIDLAENLVSRPDRAAITELADALTGKSRAVQGDAIKVLYEVGERDPALIAPHAEAFFDALASRNNRLVWGDLTALDTLAETHSTSLQRRLPEILDAAADASVIGKDRAMSILCKLVRSDSKSKTVRLLLDRLMASADNQFSMYAEMAATAIPSIHIAALRDILTERLETIEKASKRARIDKLRCEISKA